MYKKLVKLIRGTFDKLDLSFLSFSKTFYTYKCNLLSLYRSINQLIILFVNLKYKNLYLLYALGILFAICMPNKKDTKMKNSEKFDFKFYKWEKKF